MESFLKACGANGPLFLQVEKRAAEEPQRKILDQPFAVVGRDQRADLTLLGEQVSRRHAYLQVIGGTVFCIDLESRTGTHWDGQSRSFGWVYHDQLVRVGKHKIRLVNPASDGELEILKASNPFNPATPEIPIYPSAALEIRSGSNSPILWPLNRPLVLIGGALECKVRLHGAGISRIHCSLVSTPRGVWVVDLRSAGGVYLNDKRVRFGRLVNGDAFRVGSFTLRFCRKALPAKDQPVDVVEVEHDTRGGSDRFETKSKAGKDQDTGATDAGALVPTGVPMDAALAPAIQQFAQMQNQMFDQFQQTMMMMFQMFAALQKEHVEFVREEMSRIQEVSREIQELQKEILKHAPGGSPSPEPAPVKLEEPQRFTVKPIPTPSTPMPAATNHEDLNHHDARPADLKVQVSSRAQKQDEMRREKDRQEKDRQEKDRQEIDRQEEHKPERQEEHKPDKPAATAPPPDSPPADIHAWLCERMAALQEERQTRWQKILSFFGKK
ncbi:MAG: FHA domain-containing protein [Planctomycetes bacterium]|nr:FHA domain-containing protein [Planctomycetota bacterium]